VQSCFPHPIYQSICTEIPLYYLQLSQVTMAVALACSADGNAGLGCVVPAWSRQSSSASAVSTSMLRQLQEAVQAEDWEQHFAEGRTRSPVRADWSASPERCAVLQHLVESLAAQRVLEVGSFCGASALAMAEALPECGEVHVVEQDKFLVDFGKNFLDRSTVGEKVHTSAGDAKETLLRMVDDCAGPFDLVLIDADKEGLRKYFDIIWKACGFLSNDAMVCVDLTSYKGQPPKNYSEHGFPHRWEITSGQSEIDAFREAVAMSPDKVALDLGDMLLIQRSTFPGPYA